jgi:Ca2+:H+ antiporter
VLRREQELKEAKPEVNPWACLILLAVTVALMTVTAVFVRQPTPFPLFHTNVPTASPPVARRQHRIRAPTGQHRRGVRLSLRMNIITLRTHYRFLSLYDRWFGIVLLPIVSFSADATVAITFFIRQSLKAFIRSQPQPPESLAQARAIDMSIQFLLFWMPFVTLLGWWINKPMSMLFGRCHPRLSIPRTKESARRSIRSDAPRWRVLPRELCHG